MQVVEITKPGLHLKVHRGFIEVVDGSSTLGKVVLEDVEAVIVSVPGCSLSTVLIDHLADKNIPVVISGSNYLPTSIVWPLLGNEQQAATFMAQAQLKQPKKKRLWQAIVKAKINNQYELLKQLGIESKHLQRLKAEVKSGDKTNCEAQAARFYWRRLMGDDFRRDRNANGVNAALNYCYAIIRASLARSIVAAGLHPSFALHHKGPRNPLNLVDDLIEPFRPVADWLICNNSFGGSLTVEDKRTLASVLQVPLAIGDVKSPLTVAGLTMVRSLRDVILGERKAMTLPSLLSRIEMAAC